MWSGEVGYLKGEAGRRIEVEVKVSVMRVVLASASVQLYILSDSTRQSYGVEVSHDYVIITEVKNNMKFGVKSEEQLEIGGGLNVMNVNGDIMVDRNHSVLF